MFFSLLSVLMQGGYLCLRLVGKGGSFARPLTQGEERSLLERMAAGDKEAREKLILHNMRLVPHIIKKYYTTTSDQEDLISIGTIGLVKAIDSFKPEKNAKLPTYACICIQNEIFMYFRGLKKHGGELRLHDPVESDSEGLTILDTLQTSDDTQERLETEESCASLREMVAHLEPRQREIVVLRYGLNGGTPLTQREAAGLLGISRSYVSRIEKKALEALGVQMATDH